MNPSYASPYQHYSPPPPNPPPQPQYYPLQYSHHPHPHAYATYQYSPMVMYPSHRPHLPPEPSQSAPSPQIPYAAPAKRKRKSAGGDKSDEDTPASGSDMARTPAPQPVTDPKKRTKTQRACDSCRSRKIRCDVLQDTEPPFCQHCKQYGFECTFHLPITETRFKKKKLEEEAAEREVVKPSAPTDTQSSVYGPTSPAYLLHSQATISSRIYENYDLRYHHTFQVAKSGDGLITVQKPSMEDQQQAHPKPVDLRIERHVIEQLVNSYFANVAPMLPVVTKSEFLAKPNPPPMLLYSICLVAAARREVPQAIFDSIRFAVNNVIKAEDVLSTATIANLQSLLILCMTGDCHSQFVPNALSALWIRLGTAIRMAQDLGLHRAESVKQNIELRRRLWGACLISDRWTSLAYGHPYMIDVQDCDARLPSSGDLGDLYMDELVRISVVLGKVIKTIYSPSGLTFTTDDMLYALFADIENWKTNLPDHLRFRGLDTPLNAGLLHLLYSCVCMMFWRVFMRISYSCPAHVKFRLTIEKWTELVNMTGDAIDWLDMNEQVYDVWLLVAYAAVSCALVQYHTWARRQDDDAALKLRKLRDTVRRWEGSISPDHMSARRKTAEIIALLYEATQGPRFPLEPPALNPTGGVIAKPPIGLDYKKDPARPGGGVFVARGQVAQEESLKDIPPGVVISSTSESGGDTSEGTLAPAPHSSIPAPSAASEHGRTSVLFSSSPFAPSEAGTPSRALYNANGAPSAVRSTANNPQTTTSQPTSPMVNFSPIGRRPSNYMNVNPAMNMHGQAPGTIQVMNVLDGAQSGGTLQEFALADNGLLEGIPGGMFDWGQWDTFFSRFAGSNVAGSAELQSSSEQHGDAFQQPSTQPSSL